MTVMTANTINHKHMIPYMQACVLDIHRLLVSH